MTVELAEANHFHLVDARLTLTLCLDKAPDGNGRPAFIRPIRPADLEALRAIARDSHRQSRFFYDHQFAASRTEDLYVRWIEASASGYADAVWIGEQEGKPGGYVSCHLSPDGTGRIGLLAVSPAARGNGLAREMLAASLEYFRKNGMNRVSVVTQGRNVAAQRLYQRCGFLTESLQLWYHRWFLPNGLDPGPAEKGAP
ncbi:MAG TPA: GNAT family N-acetyltransferase [Bryobacteraceae bacterium]|nr:GNAT family N-acetyltransferase [Bryobacteraceae bacterium]